MTGGKPKARLHSGTAADPVNRQHSDIVFLPKLLCSLGDLQRRLRTDREEALEAE